MSWVQRSAWAHGSAPGDFVLDVVAPALGRPRVRGRGDIDWGAYFARLLSKPPGSLQGRDRYAATWVEALEAATGRRGLRFLTLLPARDVLPTRGLARATLRWCPRCYDDAYAQKSVVYEPLLWSIEPVSVCGDHDVALKERCPTCGAKRPVLTFWSMPGHCPNCGVWLGHADGGRTLDVDELEWGRFVATEVGTLLARVPEVESSLDGDAPRRLVVHAAETLVGGSWARLARLLHMTDGTVWMWQAGRVQPSLEALLRLCRVTGVSLVDALAGMPLAAARRPPHPSWLPPQSEHHAKVDMAAVALEMERAAVSDEPETLDQLAYRLRVKESRLRSLYREQCGRIVARGEAIRAERAATRTEARLRAIDDCVERYAARSIPATRRMTEEEVGFLLWGDLFVGRWRDARARVGMPL